MTDSYSQYPFPGEGGVAYATLSQRDRATDAGYACLHGMVVTRTSVSAIAVSTGGYNNGGVYTVYTPAGALNVIIAAAAGKQRYDLVVFDCADLTLKRVVGTEATPKIATNFLENVTPKLPALTGKKQILLAALWIDENGIKSDNMGSYCMAGVADLRGAGCMAVDDSTLQIDANGKLSVKASYATLNGSTLVVQEPASKAQASGIASLNSSSQVVQNPANATVTPTASKIPIADVTGKLAQDWLPTQDGALTNPIYIQVFS